MSGLRLFCITCFDAFSVQRSAFSVQRSAFSFLLCRALDFGSGAGVAPGSAVTFCCAKKSPKIAFEYPRRNSLRAARFVQTAAVSQSFYGGRHIALLVPVCFVFAANSCWCPLLGLDCLFFFFLRPLGSHFLLVFAFCFLLTSCFLPGGDSGLRAWRWRFLRG